MELKKSQLTHHWRPLMLRDCVSYQTWPQKIPKMTEKDKNFSLKTAKIPLNFERSSSDFLKLYHTVWFILFHEKKLLSSHSKFEWAILRRVYQTTEWIYFIGWVQYSICIVIRWLIAIYQPDVFTSLLYFALFLMTRMLTYPTFIHVYTYIYPKSNLRPLNHMT